MPDEPIEARAARLAQARERSRQRKHVHCPNHPEYVIKSENYGCPGCLTADPPVWWYAQPRPTECRDDHRTPAEQRAAALDAAATVWAYFEGLSVVPVDSLNIEAIYGRIQRTEGPQ